MTVTTIAVLVNVLLTDDVLTTIATIVLVNVLLTDDGDYNSSVSKCSVKWWRWLLQ